jgi:hypothetical protein
MATFDQLSDEQRAIVELVLQQGKTYGELSELLGMPESRVRELARAALVELAPLSARRVEEDWRGQLADYVLGQQAGPESTATRGHLRRSEPARTWARSLLDSLEQLYVNGDTPAIPEGDRGGRAARVKPERTPRAAPAKSASAAPRRERTPLGARVPGTVQRRRLAALGAGAALLLLLALLLWPIGILGGDDDDPAAERASSGRQGDATGTNGQGGGQTVSARARGQAIIADQGGKTRLLVQATGLPQGSTPQAYQVWLYNSEEDRRSLGFDVSEQGQFQAGAESLPANYKDYKFIDLTTVNVDGDDAQTGPSVMRGVLKLAEKPQVQGRGENRVKVLAAIELVPIVKPN